MSLDEANKMFDCPPGWICHIIENYDGTYSIAKHLEGSQCDCCDIKAKLFNKGIKLDIISEFLLEEHGIMDKYE